MSNHRLFGAGRESDWQEPDLSILDDRRSPVPDVPLELLSEPWRQWIADTASATGAPPDYVFQTVLAGLAGVCGAGMRVRVTPAWSEPLVLWQAIVGDSSTGKSAALAPMRRLLHVIEQERRLHHDEDRRQAHAEQAKARGETMPFMPSQVVVADGDLKTIAGIVSGNPRGLLLWRDEPMPWLDGDRDGADWLETWAAGAVRLASQHKRLPHAVTCAVSILDTMRPDRLREALQAAEEGLAARFLYVWPGPQPYRAIAAQGVLRDEEAAARLRLLSNLARTPDDPCEVCFDERGLKTLDGVLAKLHAERSKAEGLEAAWLGKGRSFIVRLAAAIELLTLVPAPRVRPGAIGSERVETAAALWKDYFLPHARALFDCVAPTNFSRRVRRVARWLKDSRATVVSREDVRCRALSRTVNADEAQQVLYRLDSLGFVRADLTDDAGMRGRPARRWQINPALAKSKSDYRTTGNTGK